jgi:hypothetical protein
MPLLYNIIIIIIIIFFLIVKASYIISIRYRLGRLICLDFEACLFGEKRRKRKMRENENFLLFGWAIKAEMEREIRRENMWALNFSLWTTNFFSAQFGMYLIEII